jgi:hypothetical protein
MGGFRATDEQLEREIRAVRALVRVRHRRAVADLRELDQVLRDLQQERRRRQATSIPAAEAPAEAAATA